MSRKPSQNLLEFRDEKKRKIRSIGRHDSKGLKGLHSESDFERNLKDSLSIIPNIRKALHYFFQYFDHTFKGKFIFPFTYLTEVTGIHRETTFF